MGPSGGGKMLKLEKPGNLIGIRLGIHIPMNSHPAHLVAASFLGSPLALLDFFISRDGSANVT